MQSHRNFCAGRCSVAMQCNCSVVWTDLYEKSNLRAFFWHKNLKWFKKRTEPFNFHLKTHISFNFQLKTHVSFNFHLKTHVGLSFNFHLRTHVSFKFYLKTHVAEEMHCGYTKKSQNKLAESRTDKLAKDILPNVSYHYIICLPATGNGIKIPKPFYLSIFFQVI